MFEDFARFFGPSGRRHKLLIFEIKPTSPVLIDHKSIYFSDSGHAAIEGTRGWDYIIYKSKKHRRARKYYDHVETVHSIYTSHTGIT
jgi:hypothetical protein